MRIRRKSGTLLLAGWIFTLVTSGSSLAQENPCAAYSINPPPELIAKTKGLNKLLIAAGKKPMELPEVTPESTVPTPFSWKTPAGEISNLESIRATAGYFCDSGSIMPVIYAHSGDAGGDVENLTFFLTVIGPAFEKTFSMSNRVQAFRAYEQLLRQQHFLQ